MGTPKTKLGKRINFEIGAARTLSNVRKNTRKQVRNSSDKAATKLKWAGIKENTKSQISANRAGVISRNKKS
jgi:hypothetical protein